MIEIGYAEGRWKASSGHTKSNGDGTCRIIYTVVRERSGHPMEVAKRSDGKWRTFRTLCGAAKAAGKLNQENGQ